MAEKYIKVNIPLTEEDYQTGNGEGVWVEVDEATREAYDKDITGSRYKGVLANDSLYYPGIGCGDVIEFEMRGDCRPVADFHGFLSGRDRLTEAGKALVIRKIAEYQSGIV